TGTGTASAVSFSATILTFASQTVGTPSTAQALILTNTGNASLSITSLALTGASAGDFGLINNCGSSVAVNGSCTITVTFKPAAIGSRSASISITDNAGGGPQTVS